MEYTLTQLNAPEVFAELQKQLSAEGALIVKVQSAKVGKWGMARLWRAWMNQTAEFMADNGVTMPLMIDKNGKPYRTRPFSADDAHELFTHQWLGEDENGNRLSWSRAGREGMRPATKGERLHAMRQHEAWCIDKGIILFNPIESEYRELMKGQ